MSYLIENMLGAVASAVRFVAVLEAESDDRVLGCPRIVNEERGVSHVMAVLELAEELQRGPLVSGWKKPDVEVFVGFENDSGEQPVPLIVESDHGFVNRDVIWAPATGGLEISFRTQL